MSDNQHPPRRPSGLLRLLFFAPGKLILWWDYYFPKHGDAWASGRRKNNPHLQLLYSLGFWVVVLIALLSFIISTIGSR
jgi:hypothetical protein